MTRVNSLASRCSVEPGVRCVDVLGEGNGAVREVLVPADRFRRLMERSVHLDAFAEGAVEVPVDVVAVWQSQTSLVATRRHF